jgi:Zn-dependent protease with chaperone function
MSFNAVAIHPELPGGRKAGTLHVSDFSIKFLYGENQSVEFPIDANLNIAHGGSNGNLIFFTHKNRPDWNVYTEDGKILKHPALAGSEHVKKVQSKRNSNKVMLYSALFGTLGILALFILGFIVFRGAIVRSIANQVPTSFDAEAGDKLFGLVTENRMLIKDSALLAEVNKQVAPLVAAVEDTSIKFTFYIMKDPSLNAFALPGGHIVIHSGLLEKASGWNEVQGVLGHEISHVTLRHHVRGVVSKLGAFYVLSLFLGDAGAVGSIILQTGAQLESLMYSREFETESDEQGWEYLVKAGINPTGMITFFEKLEKEYGIEEASKEEQQKMSFLSTHPATSERIQRLREKEKELNNAESLKKESGDFISFKAKLQQQLNK